MSDDRVPLLLGLALLGLGLLLNWSRIRRRLASRRARRVDARVAKLLDREQHAEAVTLMLYEIERLRPAAATDADRARLAGMLRARAHQYHLAGRLGDARPLAEEAVAVARVVAVGNPGHAAWPLVTLAQLLADQRDDESAGQRLREAYDDVRADPDRTPESDVLRVLVAANYSMVLRRLGALEQAADVAAWGVDVDRATAAGGLPEFTRASAGWLHAALATARTDLGQDGREDAREAVGIWRTLIERGVFDEHEGEGAAYADFAMAYALRPFDPVAAEGLGRQALARFELLAARAPERLERRLAEVRGFLTATA
ncbi:hypothetical protein QEZ54_33345 [Catellatospora sp. KI3]|uniref:hypothetical protein n=1 Tax=Catellatospora sp. KI3 TaxID=3041620 RepID=UPI0024821959|nr:hypothetical protein [Catellatospora sp. KI3]MDI1465870.1 hypothetical protein [Catellatospora sp. KI3]